MVLLSGRLQPAPHRVAQRRQRRCPIDMGTGRRVHLAVEQVVRTASRVPHRTFALLVPPLLGGELADVVLVGLAVHV